MPIQVALSLFPSQQHVLSPNILLSLSAIPDQLIPGFQSVPGYNVVHWMISALPFCLETRSPLDLNGSNSKPRPDFQGRETMIILFPLFQALSSVLRSLTTTSLLSAELSLLSMALINLLIHSTSPQAVILDSLLWGGGLTLLILCSHVLRWGVALARIPRWRFKKASRTSKRSNILSRLFSISTTRDEDTSDEDLSLIIRPVRRKMSIQLSNSNGDLETPPKRLETNTDTEDQRLKSRNIEPGTAKIRPNHRRNTMPDTEKPQIITDGIQKARIRRKRSDMSSVESYISMTAAQANTRRWLYAGYVYLVIISTIMIGIRPYVGAYALNGAEPVGWALGYLFGNISDFRFWTVASNLEGWICLPRTLETSEFCRYSRLELVRHHAVGEANTRLFICLYCIGVLITGLAIVFQLSSVVEVDTRRKVFHGMMVAMFLPCTFIDPVFTSLALALILAMFLLLDLIRASQLPPLSKHLAYFLTPYVDGRDLRGPVVVSHIFLLIGCAIPLWLSLAAVPRFGEGYWRGWDVDRRDLSMISGVVCVGMGDAAASLVGRRYGRRKWPWSGGKSLEGSLAFTAAVALGLAMGKVWGVFGGWMAPGAFGFNRMLLAGAGASLMEAVLTGGNDNVVVPVVLWLLVRGLQI
jgi:dolichol kinase